MHEPEKVTAYIKSEPPHARKVLTQMRALVRRLVPKATEKLAWSMPTFCLDGNLLHYAAFRNHMSIFPGPDAIRHFQQELSKFQTSKGTIQIPYTEPLPVQLVSRIVKYCVQRNQKEAQAKAEKKKSKKRTSKRSPRAGKKRALQAP